MECYVKQMEIKRLTKCKIIIIKLIQIKKGQKTYAMHVF